MASSISDTTASPAPFSPFSTHSASSDLATSDESPDLGAFTTVFRALNELQPRTFAAPVPPAGAPPTASSNFSRADEYDSDTHRGSTVWTHQPIASYLALSSRSAPSLSRASSPPPSSAPSSDTEGDAAAGAQPSLGYLDAALGFLAAERAKLAAQHSAWRGHASSTSDSAWRHPAAPRRKRRRKRAKSAAGDGSRTDTLDAGDASESSAEPASSDPAHPPPLAHSRSTPSLRGAAPDPRVVRLRALAMRLRILFPDDAAALTAVLSSAAFDAAARTASPDARGPPPAPDAPLTHVFIDYSNILIGFLTHLRRHPHLSAGKTRRLSHAALALVLERGRPTTRRVLAASSPLYQPMDGAARLGYEVRVYARVPDTGGGARTEGRRRGRSAGTTPPSTESETGRVRYREQGVDELLQLKVHQALADVERAPAGSTIVLATGDGGAGQFNEDGFRGCVRTALRKGWRVELYAWEGGLSRAWAREFRRDAFRIVHMDHFGADLVEA